MLQQQLKKLGVTRDGGPQHGYDSCSGFLQVRENWKKSGNLCGQGKVREEYFEKLGKMILDHAADICVFCISKY